jgi:peroxiredoxin Q/BCP
MSSQAKPDVDENAAQSPGETNKVTEVEVEEKMGVIDIGGTLPSISLKNEKGEDVNVAELAAEKGVVMFLVPKADTRKSFMSPKLKF